MFVSDIKRVVEQVSRDRGIDREVLIKALEEALRSAARKKYGNKMDIEVQYNEESGEIEVFQFKEVAEAVTEPETEISLEEASATDAAMPKPRRTAAAASSGSAVPRRIVKLTACSVWPDGKL